MSSRIGNIVQKSKHEVHWVIEGIFSYTAADTSYCSPEFDYENSKWCLKIGPNGLEDEFKGFSLLLQRAGGIYSSSKGLKFDLGWITADGRRRKYRGFIWSFQINSKSFEWKLFIETSELLQLKCQLAPSASLTITCSMLEYDFEAISGTPSEEALSDNFPDMFMSKELCDVTLTVGNESISAHKFVLAAHSPVFTNMFDVEMKGKGTSSINIPELDPEAFKEFLKYMYSGKVDKMSEYVFDLYRMADKFMVEELYVICTLFIMANLTLHNICRTAVLCDQITNIGLDIKVEEYFAENYSRIVLTDEWISLMAENTQLCKYLLSNTGEEKATK